MHSIASLPKSWRDEHTKHPECSSHEWTRPSCSTQVREIGDPKTMNRWLYLLLLAVPVAVLAEALHAPPLASFVLASLGLVPLAGLIGLSTEVLAGRFGQRIGGLLNATFGNAAEIIIGLTALAAGPREGGRGRPCRSIIGNGLLVLGPPLVVGGWP